eukprot:tig00020961_g16682.t1
MLARGALLRAAQQPLRRLSLTARCKSTAAAMARLRPAASQPIRHLAGTASRAASQRQLTAEELAILKSPRDKMDFDVVIVGAGPAGLSAAIRLKQLEKETGKEISVCVVEKGSEVGAHILSGNVFETRTLNELIPNWKDLGAPLRTPASDDHFWFMFKNFHVPLPVPPQMHNDGNYVISLSELVRWMGKQAEELGVEVYPGFSAAHVLYDEEDGRVVGIATNDMGIGKDGAPKDSFQRGMELRAKVTLFAEGARGSLSKTLEQRFGLRNGKQPQTYALGIKEIWEVPEEQHKPGFVAHSIGYPLDFSTYGGGLLYHLNDRQVAVGFVLALDYANPWISTYGEFQRYKLHPTIRRHLEGGKPIAYGARVLNEGGYQSVPELVFPGGGLIGCSAGFLNVPKIKGTHTAMKTGMLAAEQAFEAVVAGADDADRDRIFRGYSDAVKRSWVWQELYQERNVRPAFKWGMIPGLAISCVEAYVTKGKIPVTLSHGHADHQSLKPAGEFEPIQYPKPDGKITFDIRESVFRSGTDHDHDQPAHLRLRDAAVPAEVNWPLYKGPEGRYCPAQVYEYVGDESGGDPKLQINAQNCLHCKACDVKDPTQNINWTVPEGAGGPNYTNM